MKKIFEKILILMIVSSMILTLFITPVISHQDENDTNELICIRVLDTIGGKDTEYYVTFDELERVIPKTIRLILEMISVD